MDCALQSGLIRLSHPFVYSDQAKLVVLQLIEEAAAGGRTSEMDLM
jgi:hypothetical protein